MIELLHLDDQLLVCIKPAGVSVEGGKGENLMQLLSAQVGGTVLPVHRLDQPVGGLLLAARTPDAAAALSRQVADRSFDKHYIALVEGTLPAPQGTLQHWLYHDVRANKTYAVKKQRRGVKQAALEYTTLAATENATLVRVHLLTGRTHQIRAQFAAEGHPLVGDGRYGSRTKAPLALWSQHLRFTHPVTGKVLEFEAMPKEEF